MNHGTSITPAGREPSDRLLFMECSHPRRLLWGWLQEVNKELNFDEKFCEYYAPMDYGATDVFVRQLRLKAAFAVETWRHFDLLRRIELQKLVFLTFLKQVGMRFSVK